MLKLGYISWAYYKQVITMKNHGYIYSLIFFSLLHSFLFCKKNISLTTQQLQAIGHQIWQNECSGLKDQLAYWKTGEDFVSIGIGHFIWLPKNTRDRQFKNTFPRLIQFFKQQNYAVPEWLTATYCPWQTKHEFEATHNKKNRTVLKKLMFDSIHLQIAFMHKRLQHFYHKIQQSMLTTEKKAHIKKQLDTLCCTPHGIYILMDYLNFKGEGFNAQENYQHTKWGLLQVLENMNVQKSGQSAYHAFACTAKKVLKNRIKNSPKNRNEQQWYLGWCNRIDSYTRKITGLN